MVLRGVHIPKLGICVDVDEEFAFSLVADAEVRRHELEGCAVLVSVSAEVKHFEAVGQFQSGHVVDCFSFSLCG